ncbi:MAG: Y-family DNA polymerase [Treponema sp.]|jgi:DNA polymerase V|nr:Y-family DNA polymerase [Treponema sp.]
MIFHVDGNSFYASCERIFRPDLYDKPIAVLSNNDACIVALDNKCKDLGFRRGDVYFMVRKGIEDRGVAVCSSNYTLYADISGRLNALYHRFSPDVERYSIDESFLYFPDWRNTDYTEIGRSIREAAGNEIGVPVAVGIAPTKTLSKLCNKLAKKRGGVCEWNKIDQDETLKNIPVGDIWGIGKAKSEMLKKRGILTAYDLKRYPLDKAKKNLSIVGMRTVQELNGIAAIGLEISAARHQIICSRSFSSGVYYLDDLIPALTEYTQEAVARMRDDGLACSNLTVFLMTNPFGEGKQYSNQATGEFNEPTAYLPEIQAMAAGLLRRIYRYGYKYRKVMVLLSGMKEGKNQQPDLFEDTTSREKRERLMRSFDLINAKYGRGSIRMGAAGLASGQNESGVVPWKMRREFLSPSYTTKLSDVPKVY